MRTADCTCTSKIRYILLLIGKPCLELSAGESLEPGPLPLKPRPEDLHLARGDPNRWTPDKKQIRDCRKPRSVLTVHRDRKQHISGRGGFCLCAFAVF